jgi:hypothetical protein
VVYVRAARISSGPFVDRRLAFFGGVGYVEKRVKRALVLIALLSSLCRGEQHIAGASQL